MCLILLWGAGKAFSASPYELLRYNARFCKGDLKRVVYATLKPHVHKGCLKAGRMKLESSKSKLYNKFDHPYSAGGHIIVRKDHRLETKEVLLAAIDQRLGATHLQENLRLTAPTDFGKELFAEDVASFCALMGSHKLWNHLNSLDDVTQVDIRVRNASMVLFLTKSINIYDLFHEYAAFTHSFERLKGINSRDHKEMLTKVKKMRDSLLSILDNLVVLKKRLSQPEQRSLSKSELTDQRTKVRNALVGMASNRRHKHNIEGAMAMLDPTYDPRADNLKSALRQKYPNFFQLIFLIRYTDLLNDQCLKD